jgi:signal transduction histidine kinase
LSGFEQPRYLHVEPSTTEPLPGVPTGEVLRVPAFLARTLLAVVLIAVAPTLHESGDVTARFSWFVAIVWLPGVGLIDLLQRRRPTVELETLALVWDLGLFMALEVILDASDAAAVGFLLVAAFHAYVGGRRRAWLTGGITLLAMLVAPLLNGGEISVHRLTVELVAGALLVWMLADAAHRQDASQAGLMHVSGKADAILASIASEVIVTSPSGRVREWNPAAARTFGCHETGRGARCAEVLGLHLGMRQLRCDDGCALLDLSPADTSSELWRLDRAGHRQPLLGSASAVLDQDGVPVEIVHSFRDITAVRAADEAKTLFLATASHELKTPLTVIRGFAQMLQLDGVPEDKRAHAILAIEARAGQLAGIVDRLLMSSRIDAGRIDLDLDLIDVAPIVRERARALEGATGRLVVVDIGAGLPRVYADPDAVTTVIDHLLDNAVKYSPDGGSLAVSVRRDPRSDAVVLAVADRGVGMTAEQLEHCFERFWQAESSDVRRFGGSGIGLYIVRSLVEGMGGRISVASSPGDWTIFSCTLRTSAPADGVDDEPTEPPSSAEVGQASMIREYMRLVGVPLQHAGEAS